MFTRAQSGEEPYDLLLTDIQMPEMDGLELTARLRSAGVTTPIVAVTAHAMSEDRERCLSVGCDDYTTKPIDHARLIATCRDWIGRKSDKGTGPSKPTDRNGPEQHKAA